MEQIGSERRKLGRPADRVTSLRLLSIIAAIEHHGAYLAVVYSDSRGSAFIRGLFMFRVFTPGERQPGRIL